MTFDNREDFAEYMVGAFAQDVHRGRLRERNGDRDRLRNIAKRGFDHHEIGMSRHDAHERLKQEFGFADWLMWFGFGVQILKLILMVIEQLYPPPSQATE